MSEPCTHANWRVESSRLNHSTYGGVEQDFITFYVVCECGAGGEFTRDVQELVDECTTIYWGNVPGLTIVVTAPDWTRRRAAPA